MNKTEHLLTCLNEEGIEIALAMSHIASKALRFGPNERWARNPDERQPSNVERLVDELNDLLGVVGMMVDEGILPSDWMSVEKMLAKKAKVLKYMAYAKEQGALEG